MKGDYQRLYVLTNIGQKCVPLGETEQCPILWSINAKSNWERVKPDLRGV